jgi:thiamine-phosphate pyrophosphorylase
MMTMKSLKNTERAALAARLEAVYLLTPDVDAAGFEPMRARLEAALSGGVAVVQYRNKHASAAERQAQARSLRELVHARGALFIINDDIGLALEVDADGVHLGRDDGDLASARAALPGKVLGVSCYNELARGEAAAAAGADVLAFGSVYASSTKPTAVRASLDLLRQARVRFEGPRIVAIGGIGASNIRAVGAAGAHAAALISAVFDATDPRAAVIELQSEFNQGRLAHDSQRTAV